MSLIFALEGTCTEDKSRYKHPFTNNGVVLGDGMVFGGAENLDLTYNSVLSPLSNFSVVTWVRFDDLAVDRNIYSVRNTLASAGWRIGFESSIPAIRLTTLGVKDYDSGYLPTVGRWVCVGATLDSDYDVHFYIDGEFESTVAHSAGANAGADMAEVGATNSDGYANGRMNGLRVYNNGWDAGDFKMYYEQTRRERH